MTSFITTVDRNGHNRTRALLFLVAITCVASLASQKQQQQKLQHRPHQQKKKHLFVVSLLQEYVCTKRGGSNHSNNNNENFMFHMSRRRTLTALLTGSSMGVATTAAFGATTASPATGEDQSMIAGITNLDNSIYCETQCVFECEQIFKRNKRRKRQYDHCIADCQKEEDDRYCKVGSAPEYVREPELEPSRPVPGLYERWQDQLQ
jgi:hypothetical protein